MKLKCGKWLVIMTEIQAKLLFIKRSINPKGTAWAGQQKGDRTAQPPQGAFLQLIVSAFVSLGPAGVVSLLLIAVILIESKDVLVDHSTRMVCGRKTLLLRMQVSIAGMARDSWPHDG